MIDKYVSNRVLTIGPDPLAKGGIASVLKYYKENVFETWNFIAESNPDSSKILKLFQAATACLKLVKTLKRHPEIQIVHLHTASKISFPRSCVFMRIAKMMGRKVVLHMHGCTFMDYARGRETDISQRMSTADAVIALSDSWRNYYHLQLGCENVWIIPNIVPFPINERQRMDMNDNDIVHAVFLGEIGERKGIYDLLQAITQYKDRLNRRFMLHVGGNGEVDRFKARVDELGLSQIVTYEGWVDAGKKEHLLSESSISLLPSYAEGLPISLLEGMAHSHALISTDVGGISEIIDKENGFLLAPGDVSALGEAVIRLVDDARLRRRMGEASRRKVAPYLPDNVSSQLCKMYESLF